MDEEPKTNTGFIKHVFNFDNETKCELLNILQYVLGIHLSLTLRRLSTPAIHFVLNHINSLVWYLIEHNCSCNISLTTRWVNK